MACVGGLLRGAREKIAQFESGESSVARIKLALISRYVTWSRVTCSAIMVLRYVPMIFVDGFIKSFVVEFYE